MYGGSDKMLSQVIPKSGIIVKRVDTTNLEKVASSIGPKTKLVWIETPTNPRQQICDIRVTLCLSNFTIPFWFIS